jgi:NodT family efflux transporter outer membrane factor (OMF) lipoprotein
VIASLLVSGLSACTVGPNYSTPKTESPPVWTSELEGGTAAKPVGDLSRWWDNLNDPRLTSLVERSIAGNLDLRVARARVIEARAQRGVIAAQDGPDVNLNSSYSRSRGSEEAGFAGPVAVPGVSTKPGGSDLYQIGFDASWEIDLFGRTRRAVESADADIAAALEGERGVLVSLAAEVARNYIDVRSFQNRLSIARANAASQQDAVNLATSRYKAGLTSELDVSRAQALLAATQAQIPTLEAGELQAVHRLGVLMGRDPAAVQSELAEAAPIPHAPAEIPVGLPSELLRRRPDIRQAERQAASATARIGVATADLFPRVSLTGSVGLLSTQFGSLPQGNARFWSIGPSLTWSIFNMGGVKSNIKVQEARQEQSLAVYDQTILLAFEETENALVNYGRELVRRQSLGEAVDAGKRSVDLATELYTRGLTDFNAVIDAQRQMYIDQEELAISERTVAVNLVALYKALGGGWEEPKEQ